MSDRSPFYDDLSSKLLLPKSITNFYHDKIIPNMGITLFLISQLFNSMMILFCKLLLMDEDFEEPFHPLQILLIRMSITFICCSFFLYKDPDFPLGPIGYRKYMVGRGVGGFLGVFGQYFALMYLTVSDTVVITFLSPTVTSLMAYIFLKERFTRIEAIGGSIAFIGVILISRPSFLFGEYESNREANPDSSPGREVETSSSSLRLLGSTSALLSTFGTGIAMCSIRKISFNAKPLLTVSFYSMTTVILSFLGIVLIPGLSFQIPHTTKQWTLLGIIGFVGFIMQFLLTAGIQREKASRAVAMSYSQLIYATGLDYIVFHHFPSGLDMLGTLIIVGAVFSIIYFKPEEEDEKVVGLSGGSPDIEAEAFIIDDEISLGELDNDAFDDDARSISSDGSSKL
ncbi:hypothetical protein CANARDRAFT_27238 [[Candida] arabinofermentans NRRL YB-2248]|uniref:EamA domain-containing protein n=1 Tax=[Candida] arabinofermentans NRRL YB-2248 TaxID=983967 RepID=A0A1E4T524_9ASCO|nr:hypothetical protein CANARDRAFT_27238 [[Candida] arabinofermentans NRRL YB-2248]